MLNILLQTLLRAISFSIYRIGVAIVDFNS